jgi:1,4-dihydroxy-2-naphthoate octaprenyltransferase
MFDASATITLLENFFIHLRLKFNLYLAPIYLYGVVIANGNIFTLKFLTEFIIFHVFIYGGVNALNDYYDRDEQGPIGGLQSPPPVKGHSLLYLAWLWKLIGLYLSVKYSSSVNFVLICFICILMSVAYSHPKIRLKRNPLWSTLVVIFLQGFLSYYLGAFVGTSDVSQLSSLKFWLGAVVITLLTLGSYPLTQVYQIEQDTRQGDRTLATFLGIEKTFQLYCRCVLVSGFVNSILIGYYYHWWESVIIFINSFLLVYGVRQWEKKFERQTVVENFKSLDQLFTYQTACIYAFCIGHLFHIL